MENYQIFFNDNRLITIISISNNFILCHIKKERGKELVPFFKAGTVKDLVLF